MMELEVLLPKLKIDINTNLRLKVLAGVLYELTELCGVHIEDSISKGIVERDIIERIMISFKDSDNVSHGRISFIIDWEQFEILVQTDDGSEIYKDVDFSNGFATVLDKRFLKVLETHVKKLRKTYDIKNVTCSFRYRDKYTETEEINNATMQFLGHVAGVKDNTIEDKEFTKSLETVFQGLDGILRIKIEGD